MASDTLGTGLICIFRFGSISICPYRRRCLEQRRGIKKVEETVEELGRATRASCSLLSLAIGEGPQVLGGERQPVGTQQQARNPHSSVEEALKRA